MSDRLRVSAARLDTADDAELAWRAIEAAWGAVSLYDGPVALADELAPLSVGQRALLALHCCVAEVSNGGFDQFFTNASGLVADEALAGFERLEAYASAAVLREAMGLRAARPSSPDLDDPMFDEAEVADAFDAYLGRLAPLEERFYELMESELYPRAAAYVRAHMVEFVEAGSAEMASLGEPTRDQLLRDRIEEYAARSKERHWRLFRWMATVVPFPAIFGPRLLEQMSLSARTHLVYAWAGMVALLGLGVCVSSWRFERAHAVRCPDCHATLSKDPELFRRIGTCAQCLARRVRAALNEGSRPTNARS
jgi:hypothetical protein